MSATIPRVSHRILLRYVLIALAMTCVVLAYAALQQPSTTAPSDDVRDAQSAATS